jgi:hypothetical protein
MNPEVVNDVRETIKAVRKTLFGEEENIMITATHLGTHSDEISRNVLVLLRSFYIRNQGRLASKDIVECANRIFSPATQPFGEDEIKDPSLRKWTKADVALMTTWIDLVWNRNVERTCKLIKSFALQTNHSGNTVSRLYANRVMEILASEPMTLAVNAPMETVTFWEKRDLVFSFSEFDAVELILLSVISNRCNTFFESITRTPSISSFSKSFFDPLINKRISRSRITAHYFAAMHTISGRIVRDHMGKTLNTLVNPINHILVPTISAEFDAFTELLSIIRGNVLDYASLVVRFLTPPPYAF